MLTNCDIGRNQCCQPDLSFPEQIKVAVDTITLQLGSDVEDPQSSKFRTQLKSDGITHTAVCSEK